MIQHFVKFFSPGTFTAETSIKPIPEWNVDVAIEMSQNIKERYGSKPYGFCFITRYRRDDELDSRVIEESGIYFLGGTIKTLSEVEAENDPSNRILISNMKNNGWDRIIVNTNSYSITLPFTDKDILL